MSNDESNRNSENEADTWVQSTPQATSSLAKPDPARSPVWYHIYTCLSPRWKKQQQQQKEKKYCCSNQIAERAEECDKDILFYVIAKAQRLQLYSDLGYTA